MRVGSNHSVTLNWHGAAHHFDNFMNPFTLSNYMNLENYRNALHERCPDAKFYFSKFLREVDLSEVIGA
jgi:hypothetical protein